MPDLSRRYNIAHRGARSLAPENTMPAFLKAWEVGAHGVETDVSVTADGELVLFHDDKLSRTTDVAAVFPARRKHKICSFQWSELKKLDAGSWFVDTDPFGSIKNGAISEAEALAIRGSTIPKFEELLSFIKKKSWFINIEIKPLPQEITFFPVVERVLDLIDRVRLEPDFFSISSFHHPFLAHVAELRPEIEVNALIGGKRGWPQQWGDYGFAVYNANVRLTDAGQIARALRHGCRVNLYTVNSGREMEYFLSLGVEKIITDYPQLLAGLDMGSTTSAHGNKDKP